MSKTTTPKTYTNFVLPANVVTKFDLSRLVREMEQVDNELTSLEVRSKAGVRRRSAPVLSAQLTDFLDQNDLDIEQSRTRSALVKSLRQLKNKAPTIHMTFASTADQDSLAKLAGWLRESVHPQAVIAVGLQPGLVAGVYVRTPNHVHDLSLRRLLAGRHDVLIKELGSLRGAK